MFGYHKKTDSDSYLQDEIDRYREAEDQRHRREEREREDRKRQRETDRIKDNSKKTGYTLLIREHPVRGRISPLHADCYKEMALSCKRGEPW